MAHSLKFFASLDAASCGGECSRGGYGSAMAWRDDVTRDVATVGLTRTKSFGLAVVIRVSAHVEV